jgi:peroxiredoxin
MKSVQRVALAALLLCSMALAGDARAPDFAFTSRDGEHVALQDLRGTTVVIDFWGSWCKPCASSAPGLVTLHQKYNGHGVVFLGVAAKDKEERWGRFIDTHKMDWPQYLDRTLAIVHLFHIRAYPTYIVIDRNGMIRGRSTGYGPGTDAWLEKTIEESR